MFSIRSKLITAAAIGAAAVSAGGIASAATSGSSSSSPAGSGSSAQRAAAHHDPSKGGHMFKGKTEALLSGDKAAKVRAAATASNHTVTAGPGRFAARPPVLPRWRSALGPSVRMPRLKPQR